ncbi:MAG: restriction endonuclease subunit S [Clostridiales bacterium]|nr:restriction endonuclease subunit S [Clostridiales bacterium]
MSKVFLGDVAVEHKETCKGSKDGYPIVGLEHLVPEEITLTTWDEDSDNTFTKMFRKGDVLFGRRRAYLKKAAVAPFDGICSGDITVIEAKPDRILPELLPFIIQNDALFDFAVGKSAGSLSPRVKWEHLKNYEFELPDMDKQKELAELLWAIDDTKKAYQKLISATDELVKSQFIEMFGGAGRQSKYPTVALGSISNMISGGTPSSKHPEYFGGDIPFVSTPCLGPNYIDASAAQNWLTPLGVQMSSTHVVPAHSLMVGNRVGVGKSSINQCEMCTNQDILSFVDIDTGKYDLLFIKKVIEQYCPFYESQKRGATIKGIPSDLVKASQIPQAPIDVQREFVSFVRQSDKSKFELEQALSELTATYKRIIAENLG